VTNQEFDRVIAWCDREIAQVRSVNLRQGLLALRETAMALKAGRQPAVDPFDTPQPGPDKPVVSNNRA